MKPFQVTLLSLLLVLSLFLAPTRTWAKSEPNQGNEVNLWLVLRLRDYETDLPISNTSITATIYLRFPPKQKHVGPLLTNETGVVQALLGKVVIEEYTRGELERKSSRDLRNIADQIGVPNWGSKTQLIERILDAQEISSWKTLFIPPSLEELELSDNYSLIKVLNHYIEDTDCASEYVPNSTRYSRLQISLAKKFENNYFVEGNLWVLKGKIVRVLDSNPVTGEKENLFMAPAVKTDIEIRGSQYESHYFFPLNYKVTIFHEVKTWREYETAKLRYAEEPIMPLTVEADENTTLINWMSHAAEEYVDRQTYYVDKEMEWLGSSGYVLEQENEEYRAIKSLFGRVLELYRKGEYVSALGGARISDEKLSELKKWISDLKVLAIVTTAGISLFAYGLASLLSSFIFEEPSENKNRVVTKVLVFAVIMLIFSLTHPSLKIAFAFIIGSRNTGLAISLLGCFLIGGSTYFFIQLFSVRRKTMTDLALHLGVRSLKRRRSRTLLSLITIAIMVSSAVVFVNISLNRSTRIKAQWEGTDIPGVVINPDTYLAPLSQYDLNWTRAQEWCMELSYTEGVKPSDKTPEYQISRKGMLLSGDEQNRVDILGIDLAFIEKYQNLSEHVRGFWQEFSEGKPVAILPTTVEVPTNQVVTLAVEETMIKDGTPESSITRTLGEFRVVGTFDPLTAFIDLTRIDNTHPFEYPSILDKPHLFEYPRRMDTPPLSEDPTRLVLVPIDSIKDSAITISEATILLKEGYDPVEVAEELAYTLAATTVANKDGLAQRIEWSQELSITGLIPYLPPLVIAGLMMYATMASVYEERKREFTTLATLGLDPRNTLQVFLVEALLLGLMGTFLGFFGSYVLGVALFYLASFLGIYGVPTFPFSVAGSMPAMLVALLTGVVVVFLGAYVPAVRTQDLSLMGRVKKRQMIGELISEGDVTSLSLPIRETVQNGEMLYTYVRETLGKLGRTFIDTHSIKGELYRDGTFKVSFIVLGSGQSVFVPCELKGVREEEILVPVIEFPTSLRSYGRIRQMLRDLEEYMIGFSAWKEMQLKMKIVREAPRKRKTIEEILNEIKAVISEVKDCNKKLKILEGQKAKLSEEVYNEFKQKYTNLIEGKSKNLRSMTVNLEPYHREFQGEIDKIGVDVERITTAYNLGEIDEEEYVKTCGPLQRRLALLRGKVQELEEIFEFLKKPVGII